MHPDYEYTEGKTDFLVDEIQYIVDHYCNWFSTPKIPWHVDIVTLERAMWFFGYKGYRYHDKDIQTGFVYFKNPEEPRRAILPISRKFVLDIIMDRIVQDNLKNAEVKAIYYNYERDCFDVILDHESFKEVPLGEEYPRLLPTLKITDNG